MEDTRHWDQNTHSTHLHPHSLDGHAVVLWVAAGSHEEGSFWCIVNEHTLCRVPVEIGVVPAVGVTGGVRRWVEHEDVGGVVYEATRRCVQSNALAVSWYEVLFMVNT